MKKLFLMLPLLFLLSCNNGGLNPKWQGCINCVVLSRNFDDHSTQHSITVRCPDGTIGKIENLKATVVDVIRVGDTLRGKINSQSEIVSDSTQTKTE